MLPSNSKDERTYTVSDMYYMCYQSNLLNMNELQSIRTSSMWTSNDCELKQLQATQLLFTLFNERIHHVQDFTIYQLIIYFPITRLCN